MSYEIGYRRPPKATQFKSGASGNPKGRPKGAKNFGTLLEEALAQSVVVNDNGRRKKVSRMQAMVMRLVNGALQGDQKALLTMVEVMRKTGQLQQQAEQESLLPDDYQAVLDAYVKRAARSTSQR